MMNKSMHTEVILERIPIVTRAGFALVISLTLMSFVLVLLMSISAFVRVELQSASINAQRLKAEQNAMLGLQQALGELQATLGPDQRISAPGALLLPEDSESPRREWVGVYESWMTGQSGRPSPAFKRWLVSGPEVEIIKSDLTDVSLVDASYGLVNSESDYQVEAGVVDIDGQNRYSWWVGDEGVKVRAQVQDTPIEDIGNWLSKRGGGGMPNTAIVEGLSALNSNSHKLNLASSTDDLELLGADIDNFSGSLFHSVSLYSEGLFTNVRKGGLLNDLSFYLETTEASRPTDPLYEFSGIGGINFSELWAYYNLWKELGIGGGAHPDGGTLPSSIPVLTGDDNAAAEAVSPFGPYRRPVLVRAGWLFSVTAEYFPAEDNYQLVAVFDPIATLWNPYDVSLEIPSGSYVTIQYRSLPYHFRTYINGTYNSVADIVTDDLLNSSVFIEIGNPGNTPLAMRPGEVLIYSRSGTVGEVQVKTGYADRTFDGKLGWNNAEGGVVFNIGDRFEADDVVGIQMSAKNVGNQYDRGGGSKGIVAFMEYIGDYWSSQHRSGGFSFDQGGWGDTLFPIDSPSIFSEVPLRDIAKFSVLEGSKQHIAFFSMGLRTEEESIQPSRFLSRVSPLAGAYDIQSFAEDDMASQGAEFQVHPIDSNFSNPGFDVLGGSGFFGGGYLASTGQSKLITQSIPRSPIFSIAGFQHASASGLGGLELSMADDNTFHLRKLEPVVSSPIGNSHALPIFACNESTGATNAGIPAVDHSYLVNQALWDDWFFSSIAPQPADVFAVDRTQREVFEGVIAKELELPNASIHLIGDVVANDLFTGSVAKAEAYENSAKYLMNRGAFNVNSLNVDAWAAFLSAMVAQSVPVVDPVTGLLTWQSTTGSPVSGLNIPAAGSVEESDLNDTANEDQWLGFRSFDNDAIQKLAAAIVDEVRIRGPFLSLADFVNRRLSTNKSISKNGALQAALDKTVNAGLLANSSRSVALSDLPSSFPFPEAEVGARATGMSTFVDQADILTSIGPGLSARSDTFKIRTLGEVTDSSGDVVSAVRCEAIVQRDYEYVDPMTDDPKVRAADLVSALNQDFGRRFKIISFRWLDSEEI